MSTILALLYLLAHPAVGFAGDEPCAAITADADYDDERPATVVSIGLCVLWGELSSDDDAGNIFARARSAMLGCFDRETVP